MVQKLAFVVDPICPWTYVTSQWITQLQASGAVALSWRLFSLELVNAGSAEAEIKGHARSEPSLRTMMKVRNACGQDAAGSFYRSVAESFHERSNDLEDLSVVEDALQEAGLDRKLASDAMHDPSTWDAVCAEHNALEDESRSFGVPSLILDDDPELSIFGPILSSVPDLEESLELWEHVSWLIRRRDFAELKRNRKDLDLWSYGHFLERIEAAGSKPSGQDNYVEPSAGPACEVPSS